MKYNIFISYANNEIHIVENLREKFQDIGINAWVYSRDSTLGKDMYEEIEEKLKECNVVIFVVSDSSPNANGQQKEIELVLQKIEDTAGTSKIIPLFITGTNPQNFPEALRNKNGDFLDIDSLKSVVHKIAVHAFPSLVNKKVGQSWNYPIPGSWLEVSNLDKLLEQYFNIGDKLYFRAISPMGLFECYAPKIKDLYWISPDNVKPLINVDTYRELEESVPYKYKYTVS